MSVTRVTVAPGHWLAPGPAAAMLAALAAGMPLDITDAGRTRAEQAQLYDEKGPTGAEHPDSPKAFHVKGEAADLGPYATAWMLKHPEYGYRRTIKAEWWHWQFFAALATYEEDDMQLTDTLGVNPADYSKPETVGGQIKIASRYSFDTDVRTRRMEAQLGVLAAAVETLARAVTNDDDADTADILAAVRDGVAQALASIETTVTIQTEEN